MKLSARNQLKGRIKSIVTGAVNSEVVIELAPGIEVTAQISAKSVERLALAVDQIAYAVIKADSIMVGSD